MALLVTGELLQHLNQIVFGTNTHSAQAKAKNGSFAALLFQALNQGVLGAAMCRRCKELHYTGRSVLETGDTYLQRQSERLPLVGNGGTNKTATEDGVSSTAEGLERNAVGKVPAAEFLPLSKGGLLFLLSRILPVLDSAVCFFAALRSHPPLAGHATLGGHPLIHDLRNMEAMV